MISGIIKITNLVNEYIYIGYSADVENRIRTTKRSLKCGRYFNKYLQSDWDRLGENYFTIEVIEECPEIELVNRKQYYMDLLKPTYNVLEKSFESNKYIQRSEIALINIREASSKLQKDPKYRETMDSLHKDPTWLKNNANKNKKIANDPKWIKAHKDGIALKRSENPEWRKNSAEVLKKALAKKTSDDPDWRKNVGKKNAANPKWFKNSVEMLKKALAKKTSDDPNWRKNVGKKNAANPEWRKAISDGLKKYYTNRNSAKKDVQSRSTGAELDGENHDGGGTASSVK